MLPAPPRAPRIPEKRFGLRRRALDGTLGTAARSPPSCGLGNRRLEGGTAFRKSQLSSSRNRDSPHPHVPPPPKGLSQSREGGKGEAGAGVLEKKEGEAEKSTLFAEGILQTG